MYEVIVEQSANVFVTAGMKTFFRPLFSAVIWAPSMLEPLVRTLVNEKRTGAREIADPAFFFTHAESHPKSGDFIMHDRFTYDRNTGLLPQICIVDGPIVKPTFVKTWYHLSSSCCAGFGSGIGSPSDALACGCVPNMHHLVFGAHETRSYLPGMHKCTHVVKLDCFAQPLDLAQIAIPNLHVTALTIFLVCLMPRWDLP